MKYLPTLTLAFALLASAVQAQQPAPTPAQATTGTAPAKPGIAAPTAAPMPTDELACRVLTGHVTDKFASPLTGATIILRSRTKGFTTEAFSTNADGQYLVTCKQPIPRNTVLEVTAAGYTSIELPLADCQPQEVTLEPLPGTRFKSDGRIKKTKASGKIH